MRLPASSSFASVASSVLLAAIAALALSAGCSNQGEGEFCDRLNGNTDCQDGLVCGTAPGIAAGSGNTDRCCPVAPAQPTTAACSASSTTIEAGTDTPDASTDAGSGANADGEAGAVAEASTDAATEAAVSGDASGDATLSDGAVDGAADAGAASDASHE
jgi:hypothetical protein